MGPELGAIMLVRPPIVVYGYVVTVATIKITCGQTPLSRGDSNLIPSKG